MRSKEEANDYRYFPDPDLLPVEISEEKIDAIKLTLPELPDAKKSRYKKDYGLKDDDAEILSLNSDLSEFFEDSMKDTKSEAQMVSNFILSELVGLCNKHNIDISNVTIKPSNVSQLMNYVSEGKISSKQAKDILNDLWAGSSNIDDIIKSKNIEQVSDADILTKEAQKILEKHPKEVQDYKNGKIKLMGFFVGQIMKEMKGKANPKILNQILNKLLGG